MKKIIILSCLAVSSFVLFNSCEKNAPKQTSTSIERKLDIEVDELKAIIEDLNSHEKVGPGWWEKVKKWVNSHSGRSQEYVNGQPSCAGGGGCGPCPGICISGSGISEGGENGEISDADINLGLRPLLFTIIVKNDDPENQKLLIEIPQDYVNDFIMNGYLKVDSDESLPDFIVKAADANSITMKAGLYPSVRNDENGNVTTIVNISVD